MAVNLEIHLNDSEIMKILSINHLLRDDSLDFCHSDPENIRNAELALKLFTVL